MTEIGHGFLHFFDERRNLASLQIRPSRITPMLKGVLIALGRPRRWSAVHPAAARPFGCSVGRAAKIMATVIREIAGLWTFPSMRGWNKRSCPGDASITFGSVRHRLEASADCIAALSL